MTRMSIERRPILDDCAYYCRHYCALYADERGMRQATTLIGFPGDGGA